MNTRNAILAMTAGLVMTGLGVLAHLDTAFQDAATDVGVILLGFLVLCGLLGALIAPLLDYWTADPDPDQTAMQWPVETHIH